MSADDELRAAHERAVERERIRLLPLFAPPVASALERYFSETVGRGMPTDAARRALAETLAPYGLADPDGDGRLPAYALAGTAAIPAAAKLALTNEAEVQREHLAKRLDEVGVSMQAFRAEFARRNRESVKPVTARQVAESMRRNPPPRAPSWPLRLRKALARLVAPSDPENGSQ